MLGITTYEGTASTPLPLQRMLAGSKELAQKVINIVTILFGGRIDCANCICTHDASENP